MSLTKKVLSGPGIGNLEWNTTYATAAASWAPCNSCVNTTQVTVTNPAGQQTRYTFGTMYKDTEGQLQKTEVIDGAKTLRTTVLHYAEPMSPLGKSDQSRGDGDMSARVFETDQQTVTQDGVNFSWNATSFDPYIAKPTVVTRASSLGPTRTETTVYHRNVPKWVLGLVESVSVVDNGVTKQPVGNVYNTTTSNLEQVYHFGHLDQTMTYYADGTLQTKKDGLNHTTTFSNYKNGIAQAISYPDGGQESAVVDSIGLIRSTSILTEFGTVTTSYDYDAIGRLKTISQPTGDGLSWNDTTLAFEKVASTEYDLPAGHWRQTITTGNGKEVNYFDALWRPVYNERWDNADRANTLRSPSTSMTLPGGLRSTPTPRTAPLR